METKKILQDFEIHLPIIITPIIEFMQTLFPKSDPELKRGAEKQCQVCQKKFSITTREHQCKRCMKAVCSDCGNYHREVYSSNFVMRAHRVCKICKDGSEYICEYIKNNNLRFGEMSQIGQKWAKKMTKKSIEYGNHTSQHKLLTKQAFSQLWNSYSFQLRELVGVLTFQLNQEVIYNVVYNVFTTVISATSGYTVAQIIYLIMFILCFCSSDRAALLVIYLLELKPNSTKVKDITISYLKTMPFKGQYNKIEKYIQYRLDKYMDSFMVNCITMEASISLISKTMDRKNIDELLMIFAAHIYVNREWLAKKVIQSPKPLVDYLMMRNCFLEDITANFKFIKTKNISLVSDARKSGIINFPQKQDSTNGLKRMQTLGNNFQDKNTFQDYLADRQSLDFTKYASFKGTNAIIKSDDEEGVNSFQDNRNFKKASPEANEANIGYSFQIIQHSPPINTSSTIQDKNSPFRQAVLEQLSEQQLPQFFQMIEPIKMRKSTDGLDRKSFQTCEKCQYYIQESEKLANRTKQKQLQWIKIKQELQSIIKANKVKMQQIHVDNIELQKKYNQISFKYKETGQHLQKIGKQLADHQQKKISLETTIQEMKREKEKINQQLQASITVIESQKRELTETKELFIETHKKLQNNNLKLKSSKSLVEQQVDKQNKLKIIVDLQESDIQSLKRKITDIQQQKQKQNQNTLSSLQQNLKQCEQKLKKMTKQNSQLKESIDNFASLSIKQKKYYQQKINSLSQINCDLQMTLKDSLAEKGQQGNFFIRKTADQEKTINQLNLSIKSYHVDLAQTKEQLTKTLKQSIRSTEIIQSLRISCSQLQENNQLNCIKLQKYEKQILHLRNQYQQLEDSSLQTLQLLKGKQQRIKLLQNKLQTDSIANQRQGEYKNSVYIKQMKNKQDQINLLKIDIDKQSKSNQDIMAKLSQICQLMMLIEGQKLDLAEQNFTLHEIMKKNRIKLE